MQISHVNSHACESTEDSTNQFANDVLLGLGSEPKSIPPKYFYDDIGSQLFQRISSHPDYYPTRIEYDILLKARHEFPALLDSKQIDIIELGAGDGHKSALIIDGLLQAGVHVNFYAVDISEKAMQLLEPNLPQHDNLHVHGVVADYFAGLSYLRQHSENHQLVLFLGSNIGNFDPSASSQFLHELRARMNSGDFLLAGFDLKKDVDVLTRAYNDSEGLTREFNLNMLDRMNRELGAEFERSNFQHLGFYNPLMGAMESYLLATKEHSVRIAALNTEVQFEAFEPIHLEYSFKFLPADIERLCQQADFHLVKHFSDQNDMFIDSLWMAC